jgi:hypothetical protein
VWILVAPRVRQMAEAMPNVVTGRELPRACFHTLRFARVQSAAKDGNSVIRGSWLPIAMGPRRRCRAAVNDAVLTASPFWPNALASMSIRVTPEMVLVIRFPEVGRRCRSSNETARPQLGCINVGDGVEGDLLVVVVPVRDRR